MFGETNKAGYRRLHVPHIRYVYCLLEGGKCPEEIWKFSALCQRWWWNRDNAGTECVDWNFGM